jgi:undecaprenyl pyrophosphate phosphatase UppP
MSVPAVLGILALEIMTGSTIPASITPLDMILIEAITFIVGLASMEFLLQLARRVKFWKLCLVLALFAILVGVPAFL